MTSPVLSLRAAILAHLSADSALAASMGGSVRLYDEKPRAAEPVYAVFGDVSVADASVQSSPGHEQRLDLIVWSRPGSTASGVAAAERIGELLHEAELALDGHRLVNCRLSRLESGRDPKTNGGRIVLTFRAVSEVI